MTLSDVHDSPELLARYLGVPFEDTTATDLPRYGSYASYSRGATTRTVTAAERVARHYREYRAGLQAQWAASSANPYRPQTHGQFVAECLRLGLGIKGKGKLADRIEYAKLAHPHLYGAADGTSLRERRTAA